ncbi:MAG: MCE family protein [Bacteriovoracaceae bacterium]|nr:MCE family protein [Bacteriovoracaceae bacterium]
MTEFKVGLMALATMAAIVFMSFKITSNQSGFGDYVEYKTIVKDASGIFPKTPIKVAGINAGRIKKIELIGNNALITFEVLEKVKISTDSKLRIKTVGFLGDKFLEIQIGKSDKRLESGGSIVALEGAGLETIMKDASEVVKDVKEMISSLKNTLAPVDSTPPIKKILNNVEKLTADAKDFIGKMKTVVVDNDKRINDMIVNFEKVSKNLAKHTDDQNKESAISDLKNILSNAKKASDDLRQIIADIKAGKGTVGQFLADDGIADEVKETLSGVQKLVNKVDSIRTELAVFTGANTEYGAESSAHLKIFPSPERFYLLGLTTSEFGPESENITTTSVNGGAETITINKEKKKDQWRFDVQLGRKIHNWSFRGGLIESSGGLGLDYHLESWTQRFSFDIFDYSDAREYGVNFRISTQIQMWNVLYGKLAGEDLLEDNRSATISAGLRFNDEDLKGLIGFFF